MQKETEDTKQYLDGKLLVAMPGMGDSRFERSVIFMCAHSAEGAMGLIVNKPVDDLKFKDLLEQLKIEIAPELQRIAVHFGGPVEHGRGFVLHSPEYGIDQSTMSIDEKFGMTATIDILQDLAVGNGPDKSILALGYAGWGPGQLEGEIQSNGWLICEADSDLVFAPEVDQKWEAALSSMGVDPRLLSSTGGRA